MILQLPTFLWQIFHSVLIPCFDLRRFSYYYHMTYNNISTCVSNVIKYQSCLYIYLFSYLIIFVNVPSYDSSSLSSLSIFVRSFFLLMFTDNNRCRTSRFVRMLTIKTLLRPFCVILLTFWYFYFVICPHCTCIVICVDM